LKIEDFRMVFYHPVERMESDTKKDAVIAKERTQSSAPRDLEVTRGALGLLSVRRCSIY
jgi:hypothetical protein